MGLALKEFAESNSPYAESLCCRVVLQLPRNTAFRNTVSRNSCLATVWGYGASYGTDTRVPVLREQVDGWALPVRFGMKGQGVANLRAQEQLMAEISESESTDGTFRGWWSSPWGPGPLVRLALPLMLSAGFVSLTLFTDRTLLYWHSEASTSAAMGGGALYWSIICLPMGMLGYFSTFVSQYRGAKHVERIGVSYQHAMLLAWCFVPVMLLAIALAWYFYAWAGHSQKMVELEASYLRILLVGGIGVLFYSVQSGLLTGYGRTRTVLAIDAIATVINLILDVVLIFGWGPIPAMGLYGAALATASSFWLKIPMAAWIIARSQTLNREAAINRKHAWEMDVFKRLILYGGPAGLQMLAEAGCFSVIMLQVGNLGELEMAATTLALGLNVLAFVPMIGLGIGVGVQVGHRLTEGRIDLAKRTVTCAIGISVIYTSLFACLLGVFPNLMISIYEFGTPAERFDQMQPLLVPLLRIIAIYCILDGLQVVYVGAIKGAGDTWFVLFATFLISTGAVFTGVYCQSYLGPSLNLWWYVIAGWVGTMGIVFASRYFSGSWQSKRVIETSEQLEQGT